MCKLLVWNEDATTLCICALFTLSVKRPLHNATFFRQARKVKNLTGGIH
jgi:hypothetical protein